MNHIETLVEKLQPYRQRLVLHPLYNNITTIENLRIFTEHHVYAVWDFMSLLKSLQINLTCVSLPWVPVGNAGTRYLINEIVTGEESDVDEKGVRSSHFELYLRAMEELGSDYSAVNTLIQAAVKNGIQPALQQESLPTSIRRFLGFTFDVIAHSPLYVQAAVFTFGREDLIPDMFVQIVNELAKSHPENLSIFKYYLERHIEVDGDEHSHLGKEMVAQLCGDDLAKWEEAAAKSIEALQMRNILWDGILEELASKK